MLRCVGVARRRLLPHGRAGMIDEPQHAAADQFERHEVAEGRVAVAVELLDHVEQHVDRREGGA